MERVDGTLGRDLPRSLRDRIDAQVRPRLEDRLGFTIDPSPKNYFLQGDVASAESLAVDELSSRLVYVDP